MPASSTACVGGLSACAWLSRSTFRDGTYRGYYGYFGLETAVLFSAVTTHFPFESGGTLTTFIWDGTDYLAEYTP